MPIGVTLRRVQNVRANIGRAVRVGENHAAALRLRAPPDKAYLDQLARQLAADACLPLLLACRRVE